MSEAQLRVLGILAATAALEAYRSPNVRNTIRHPLQAAGQDAAAMVAYAISAGLLILLAGAAPGLATGLAVLIFLLALLNNASLVTGLIQGATNLLHNV